MSSIIEGGGLKMDGELAANSAVWSAAVSGVNDARGTAADEEDEEEEEEAVVENAVDCCGTVLDSAFAAEPVGSRSFPIESTIASTSAIVIPPSSAVWICSFSFIFREMACLQCP